MSRLARLRTRRPIGGWRCNVVTGHEKCCCGCPELRPIWCRKRISRLRWVLVGHCGQHQEQP